MKIICAGWAFVKVKIFWKHTGMGLVYPNWLPVYNSISVTCTSNSIARPEKLPWEWKHHRLLVVQWCTILHGVDYMHAMTITSPSTCSQALYKPPWHDAVTFMLSEVYLPVMLIVDPHEPCQCSPAHLFQLYAFAYTVQVTSDRVQWLCMHMTTIT